MITFPLLILFLCVIGQCGCLIVLHALPERRKLAIVPLGLLIGLFGYTTALNALGFFVPVQTAMWSLYAVFGASAMMWFLPRTHARLKETSVPVCTAKQAWILLSVAACVALLSGVVALRSQHTDDLSLTHTSLAATIVEGNMPVRDPSAPDELVEYHYVPELFAATFFVIAGLPLWLGYDLQILLFSGLTILIAFLLAHELTGGRFRNALITAALLFYGGGFAWLNLLNGIQPLWSRFVSGQAAEHPWLFLNDAVNPAWNSPFPLFIHNHTPAVGFPLLLLILFLVIAYIMPRVATGRGAATILAALLFGHLALADETGFVVLFGALCAAAGALMVFVILRRLPPLPTSLLFAIGCILSVGIVFAATQGGLLQQKFRRTDSLGPRAVTITTRPWILDYHGMRDFLFGAEFFKQFGLPLILFLPAMWHYRRDPRMLLVGTTAAGAFLVPVVIHYVPGPNQLLRFFHTANPLFACIAGMYLASGLPDHVRRVADIKTPIQRWAVLALVLIPISGFLVQAVYLITPLGKLGRMDLPFPSTPPQPTALDQQAYAWIKQNTTLNDRFFPFDKDFVRDTGRFTPGFFDKEWGHEDVKQSVKELTEICSAEALKRLHISYFYVRPNFPITDVQTRCDRQLQLSVVFETRDGSDFRTIYSVQPKVDN